MSVFDFLTMVGGLALFLYGMTMLGDGLTKVSGGKFESILEKLTSNPFKAVLVGAGVTAVIQSSSATTVMVVGFVNSGIMKLQQAVGIIMGANVGTTVTAWILGVTGIDSESFWIQMCKPTSFSPVLAIVAVAILMFAKKDRLKSIATVMLGFAILMFGMDTMSAAVKPLADVPEFTGILTRFSNPLLGVLAGLLLTFLIQSSSASVGILQALCMTGAVSYGAAIPIIMGQNIGTCVTALLSSIGAKRNAKRAALIHLYFNMIGTVVFMAVFYLVNALRPFGFMTETASALDIAMIHSLFNVATTICLFPFSRLLVKLACLTIREEEREEQPAGEEALQLLDERFLETPAYAVEQSRTAAVTMAELAEESVNCAISLLREYDEETAARVLGLEERTDGFEDGLGKYLVRLSAQDMSEQDSRTVTSILHCITDFERISDYAGSVRNAAAGMYEKDMHFSEKAQKELEVLGSAVHDILKLTTLSFAEEDPIPAGNVEPLAELIEELVFEIRKRHVRRLRKGKCTIELGLLLTDILGSLERVAGHCSNIAICMLQEKGEDVEPHAYVNDLKQEDNMDFQGKVAVYRERYVLP